MTYTIRHITRYFYSSPVQENVMEARLQPLTEGPQRCLEFDLQIQPGAHVQFYRDFLGNIVHHFDIPAPHNELIVTAESRVDIAPFDPLPEALPLSTWQAYEGLDNDFEFWDFTKPSRYVEFSPLLCSFRDDLGLNREADPLTTLLTLNQTIYRSMDYAPQSTEVDSHIDEALASRKGVCQDFTHIMIALIRSLSVPCRYVSGYLFHRVEDHDRSAQDASHAWLEAYLPSLGWVGLDPTNNLVAGERHIRVGVGRDYADVPPTRGVFRGDAESDLEVGVRVALSDIPQEQLEPLPVPVLDEGSLREAMQMAAQQ